MNPVGMAFEKQRAHLRANAVGAIDALCQPIGDICGLLDPDACRHCSGQIELT